jgi:hypothetical protein
MKFFGFASLALAALTGFVSAADSNMVTKDFVEITNLSDQANKMVSGITVVNVLFQGPVSLALRIYLCTYLTCL